MSKYMDGRLSALTPYVPGEQPQDKRYIKLNTNESPFAPASALVDRLAQCAPRLNLYPDPEMRTLSKALADTYSVQPENVFVGNGSDEILAFCFMAFCGSKGACYPDISYGFYRVYSALCCIDAKEIPLQDDFSINPADYYNTGRTVFIANPNAPTGLSLSVQDIARIAEHNDGVVVIDEAYVDFGGTSCLSLLNKFDNLLIVRTFSKSRNLAGGRIGFALGNAALINDLRTIKFSFNPYNVNALSETAALCALEDVDYFETCLQNIQQARESTVQQLKELGFVVLPSDANFVFAKPPRGTGEELYLALKDRGVLVRHFAGPRTGDYVRITIGTNAQMDVLLAAVQDILKPE